MAIAHCSKGMEEVLKAAIISGLIASKAASLW